MQISYWEGSLFHHSDRPVWKEAMEMTKQNFRELVVYSMGVLAEKDVMHQVSFQLLDGHNDGFLRLQRGYQPDAQICLSTGAVAPGDDHLVQHFIHYAANMEEMSAWLRDEGNVDTVIDSLEQLSARVDSGLD